MHGIIVVACKKSSMTSAVSLYQDESIDPWFWNNQEITKKKFTNKYSRLQDTKNFFLKYESNIERLQCLQFLTLHYLDYNAISKAMHYIIFYNNIKFF